MQEPDWMWPEQCILCRVIGQVSICRLLRVVVSYEMLELNLPLEVVWRETPGGCTRSEGTISWWLVLDVIVECLNKFVIFIFLYTAPECILVWLRRGGRGLWHQDCSTSWTKSVFPILKILFYWKKKWYLGILQRTPKFETANIINIDCARLPTSSTPIALVC